jgi:hypothetical protein
MTASVEQHSGANFIDAPRDVHLVALHAYWLSKRGARRMPARADIDPTEFKDLLPHIIMYDVDPERLFPIRLVGEATVTFLGRNFTGQPAASAMEPAAAATMRMILSTVADTGTPRFRAGKAWWWREKAFRNFEACFLPLSPDDRTVNIILGGIKFDV